ncbi:unnamed protein product [Cochlearia groenlandica]
MDLQPEIDKLLSPAIISDRVLINGIVRPLTLSNDGELRWKESGRWRSTAEILSFVVEDGNKVRVKILVDRWEGICCRGRRSSGGRDYARKDLVIEPLSHESRNLWCDKLNQHLESLCRPKRLLVIVNPFSGKKTARKVFVEEVKPLLDDAEIQLEIQETKYKLHTKEIVVTMDVSKYDGIVCVSGDGVLVEVVNGLLERADWRTALKLPIGMVPAGSGNGMIKSLLEPVGLPCCATSATISIIQGRTHSLDVATISQGATKFFSVLMIAWGLVADIDIESEKFRWMGNVRFDIYGFQRITCLRQYNGQILFTPAPGFESFGQPASCSVGKESSSSDTALGYRGPDKEFEDQEWREIKGPFVSVWLHNVPWSAENTLAAPDAKFSDGFLDLIVMKDCPKLALLSLMTKLSDGTHVQSPYVTYLKVKAFVLEPGARIDKPDKEGIIDSDGEVLARGKGTYRCNEKALMCYDKVRVTVDQGLATLFSPD